jgi:hypothetical protein
VHKCYGYPFVSTAAIIERDAIFIPSGWDNPNKTDILLENLHRLKSTSNYADVFVKPVHRRVIRLSRVVRTTRRFVRSRCNATMKLSLLKTIKSFSRDYN